MNRNTYYNNRPYGRSYHKKPEKPKVEIDFNDKDWKDKVKKPKADTRTKTSDVLNTKGCEFEGFNLSRPLLMGIFEKGFERPSPIQEAAIPCILMGKSILARAKNGTGKTGAFSIPCLHLVDPKKQHIQVLVLLPTRELALQTANVLKSLGKYLDLDDKIVTSTGGTDLKSDIIRLKRDVRIVVGTPGRLQDLAKKRDAHAQHAPLNIDNCNMIVLDEADKLLSTDFLPAVTALLEYTPKDRQLLLFSATFPSTIKSFKDQWLKECETINLMDELTLKGVSQYYAYVDESEKVHCLYALFRKLTINQCIIFCNSVNRVELLCTKVTRLGFPCYYIHGQMGQKHRNRVFHNFRQANSNCRTLICTDIFTRGIDIQNLNVVINFDFPRSANTYLHRIGRSGRFGHMGLAINFITNADRYNLCAIETHLNTEVAAIPKEIDASLY